MNNRHCNFFFFISFIGAILLGGPVFAEEDNQANTKTVSRTENVSGAFDDNLSLNALAKKITDKKLQENSDVINRLAGKKAQTPNEAAIIKQKIAMAEQQGKTIKASHDNYGKATKVVGGVGKALAIYDAYQSSYVQGKDGKKEFSKTAFVKNAAMNLSGVAGLASAYKAGMETKEKEFLKYLDEYEKAGKDITDPEIIYKALAKATGKALIVGAYEGAKCIPLAGDAINVYELTESSVGLVHDTLESQRIRQENKDEQDRQAGASIAKFKSLLQDGELCRQLYDKLEKQEQDLVGQFKKLRNQYTDLENRAVQRSQQLATGDELEKACKEAAPFLESNYLKALKDNAIEMDRVTTVTLKLADTTLAYYRDGNTDEAPLKKSSGELTKMLESLTSCKNECDKIIKVLNPLLGGQATFEQSQNLSSAANTEALISGELMQNARDLVSLQNSIFQKCRNLQAAQQQIQVRFDNAYNYFSIHSQDAAQTQEIIGIKNNLLGVMIKDYQIKKLQDSANSLATDLNYWRKPSQPAEGMKPELAELLVKATSTEPEIATLRSLLNTRIEASKAMINKLNHPGDSASPEPSTKITNTKPLANQPKLSEAQLAKISILDIREMDKQGDTAKAFGFKTIRQGTEGKTVESGTIRVQNPNTKAYEVKKYIIGYERSWDTIDSSGWHGFYQPGRVEKQILDFSLKNTPRKKSFPIPNAEICYIGYTNSNLESAAGYAGIGPFLVRTTWDLFYSIDNRSERVPYEGKFQQDYPWKYIEPSDRRKLLSQIEFWRNKMPEDLKDYLNARLIVSKQVVDFADKHFYKTPDHLLDGLDGFEKAIEERHIQAVQRRFKKKWDLGGGYAYSVDMSARAYCCFPEWKESWPEMQKKRINLLKEHGTQIRFNNADFAVSTLKFSQRNQKIKGQNVSLKKFSGTITFMKNNVVVTVYCSGDFPANENIDPHQVAVTILANIKKPSILQDEGKK